MKIDSEEFHSLFTPQLTKLNDLFVANKYQLRMAGGAVRDLLMGIKPADVDFASDATPTQMKELFSQEGIRMLNKNGEEHGTVTCRIDDKENFEITTLRIDVVCDGRRAKVEFTTDWQLDANRRDLTINSLFLELDGTVIDYFGGIEDLRARRVAFVGDATQRIQEDYLRILRYFRFFGRIAKSGNAHEESTLDAIVANKQGLKNISGERIWSELKKICVGRFGADVLTVMLSRCGLTSLLGLPEDSSMAEYHEIFDYNSGRSLEPMTPLNRKKMGGREMVVELAKYIRASPQFIEEIGLWEMPEFPVNGRDLMGTGVKGGPVMRKVLTHLFEVWKKSDYKIVRDELLSHITAELLQLTEDDSIRRCKKRKSESSSDKEMEDRKKMGGREMVVELAKYIRASPQFIEEIGLWEMPEFPVNGRDLMGTGVKGGPVMRKVLTHLFEVWKKSDYKIVRDELLSHITAELLQLTEDDSIRRCEKRKSESSSDKEVEVASKSCLHDSTRKDACHSCGEKFFDIESDYKIVRDELLSHITAELLQLTEDDSIRRCEKRKSESSSDKEVEDGQLYILSIFLEQNDKYESAD
ncbi:CCA tRNA nucleotidyltransferase 1, mitochondrial [Toxocara canis]|uniref:CCA tRNA nucleotidyltransferase 1, mitochondrial n=1 Tax=Toxocara canis TaxID=6265 RepID=A0A0B2W0Z3_TOXCA|nr:CCA tRNA nucleotidyltransferase 1, mitochondrial [Toxocara canis]